MIFTFRLRASPWCKPSRQRGTMGSRRSFLHLGLVAAATLSVSSASAAPAYFGSPRGGGTVTARDDAARTFTAARRRRAWTPTLTSHHEPCAPSTTNRVLSVTWYGRASEVASCGQSARGRHRRH